MSATLILVGDMHLGRRPSRLPSRLLEELDIGPQRLTPVAAWEAVTARAVERGVDAVVLAGDLVERESARWEALPVLQRTVARLAEAGIDVCAVSGNHDVEVLPGLARRLDGLHLLGEGGRWELYPVRRDGAVAVRILGWSFPHAKVHASPLADGLPPPPGDGVPTVGVLHCDLDASESPYAPVRRAELESSWPDAWFLGHVHEPSPLAAGRPLGYLGSLVGLDPGESGARGAWIAEIDGGGVRLERLPAAPVRWERVTVSVAEYDRRRRSLQDLLAGAMESRLAEIEDAGDAPLLVGVRLRLAGRTSQHADLEAELDDLRAGGVDRLRAGTGGTILFAERVVDDAEAARDLDRLAAGCDLPALLARDILALERNGPDAAEILAAARAELDEAAAHRNFLPLRDEPRDEAGLRRLLLVSARRTLDALLAQRSETDAPA